MVDSADSALVPCDSCRRHVRDKEAACPFCGVARQPGRLLRGGVSVLLGAALGASAKTPAEELSLGEHIALTTQMARAEVDRLRAQEEVRLKEQALMALES